MQQVEHIQKKLDAAMEVSLAAVAFFLPLSLPLADSALAAGALLWLAKLAATRGRAFYRVPLAVPLLCFAAFGALSIVVSADAAFSFYNYHQLMGRYLLVYYLFVQNVTTLRALKWIVGAAGLSALCVAGYGFYQYVHGIDITAMRWVDGEQFPELKTRVFSTLENPNLLAGYLSVVMSVAFGFFCKLRRGCGKSAAAALFLICGACLLLTYSRGAWLSLFAVFAFYGALQSRRLLFWVLLCCAVALLFDGAVAERLASSFDARDTSSSMRIALWESTIAMIVEHPLLGVGWGVYWKVYPLYDFFIQNDAVKIVHAHNMYLNIAAETGVFGLLAFLACLFGHAHLAFTDASRRASPFLCGLALGAGLALAVLAVGGLTDYVLFNTNLSMLFWLICGVIVLAGGRSLP